LFQDSDEEDAVFVVGLDVLRVDGGGEQDAALEGAVAALHDERARACGCPLKALGDLHGVAPRRHDLDDGVIEVIRFIRSDGAFHLFGLSYRLPETAVHEYVVGKILVAQGQISFFLGQQHLANDPFAIC